MKKKLLFVINNMEIGGTRSSLLNLISYISNENIEINLFLLSPFGTYMDKIPQKVKILKTPYILKCCFSKVKDLNYIEILIKSIFHFLRKVIGYNTLYSMLFKRYAKQISNYKFDAVIGFQEGESNDFASFIDTKSISFWIHNDYDNLKGNGKGMSNAYKKADNIFFVAVASLNNFVKAYPDLKNKCMVIRNTLDIEKIRTNAMEKTDIRFEKHIFNIISVGRIATQKRYDRILEVVPIILEKTKNFKWYILGEGDLRETLTKSILERGLENYIEFLGAKKNPYPIIKQADILVVTSDYESQPMVILESMALNVPVVSTNFSSAIELAHKSVETIDLVEKTTDSIAKGILNNMDVNELKKKRKYLVNFTYNNDKIIDQLLYIIGLK